MRKNSKNVAFIIILLAGLTFGSCSRPTSTREEGRGAMDTPSFHVQRGDEALMVFAYEEARSAYNRALQLDSDYSPALSGLAVATAYTAARPGVTEQTRKAVLSEAQKLIDRALNVTPSKDRTNLARAHVFAVQVYLALQIPTDQWAKSASLHFEKAIKLTPDDPSPYFFMGRVEAVRFNYEEAGRLFQKVLSIGGQYVEYADRELEQIQNIQRAMPGSQFGARIANIREITRADIAALFVIELQLNRIFRERTPEKPTAYRPPSSQQRFATDPLQSYPEAVDIAGHPLAPVIQEVIDLDIKGLSPDPAHRFHPDQAFSRAEFAQLIQDVLIRVTRDEGLATRFIGEPSPFPDVNADVWFYNAVRTVVSRGLMQVDDKVTGAFGPQKTVSGADALLAIRSLKGILESYLR
jgi:tetratricopeptide (TPR) repeat protein